MTTIDFMDDFESSFLRRLADMLPSNTRFLRDLISSGKAVSDSSFDELLDGEFILDSAPEWLKSAVDAGFQEVSEFACLDCERPIALREFTGVAQPGLNNTVNIEAACPCKHCGGISYINGRLRADFQNGQVLFQQFSRDGDWEEFVYLEK